MICAKEPIERKTFDFLCSKIHIISRTQNNVTIIIISVVVVVVVIYRK